MRSARIGFAFLHAGALLGAGSIFLDWSRVGGRNRSGFGTAELLLALSDNGLPEFLRWWSWLWYLGAVVALLAWAAASLGTRRGTRLAAAALFVVAGALSMVLPYYLGRGVNVLWTGPVAAVVAAGMSLGGTVALSYLGTDEHHEGHVT